MTPKINLGGQYVPEFCCNTTQKTGINSLEKNACFYHAKPREKKTHPDTQIVTLPILALSALCFLLRVRQRN